MKMQPLSGMLQFIDWGDGSVVALNQYFADSSVILFSHTYSTYLDGREAYLFHNDKCQYSFIGGTPDMLQDVVGDIPTEGVTFSISGISTFGSISDLSVSNNTGALQIFTVAINPNLESFSGDFFLSPMPAIKRVLMLGNNFDSATKDMLVNTFVANSWDGISGGTGYVFNLTGGDPYTIASQVSRSALIAKGWVVS
jgi:hypothetical protein